MRATSLETRDPERSWEELGTRTAPSWRSLGDPDGQHLDRCHSRLPLTRFHRETAPTSENELYLALRCAPKTTTTSVHDPFLVRCKTPEPSCPQANHRTNPPPRVKGQSLSSVRHRCRSLPLNDSQCRSSRQLSISR